MRRFRQLLICLTAALCLAFAGCGEQENRIGSESAEGEYFADVKLEGGTGKATVASPARITVKDGQVFATIEWSSKHYDYMVVGGEKYLSESPAGEKSVFTFPISEVPCELEVVADTVAMSVPHEIEYRLIFSMPEETEYSSLEETGSIPLAYATGFSIHKKGIYTQLSVKDGEDYLLVPNGAASPKNVPEDVVVLKQPFDHTYLVATSAMDMICALDALENVTLTGTKEDGWYVDSARRAMEEGKLLYAGKYSMPDYEMILSKGCNLALESTMIYHNPEVKEKLQEIGIPVVVERSSYEAHPLGRLEWIKFYGALFGKEAQAEALFEQSMQKAEAISQKEKTNKRVGFFYITQNGTVNVRKPKDYVPCMIEMAGGIYALDGYLDYEDNAFSTMSLQMEDFYMAAQDADILIYNSTTTTEVESLQELLSKNENLKEFRAVREKQVYCTGGNFFQETMGTCEFVEDLYKVMTGSEDALQYLRKLQ